MAFVDCGSGHTSVVVYATDPADGRVTEVAAFRDVLPPLAGVLGSREEQTKWLDGLKSVLRQCPPGVNGQACVETCVGATGGLRAALKSGQATTAQVQAFAEAVPRLLGNDASTFRTLTPTEEGLAELRAVRHLTSDADMGLLSGGGQSCQLGGCYEGCHSVEVDLNRGKQLMARHGVQHGAEMYSWHVRRIVANAVGESLRTGPVTGIEMMPWIACTKAGLALGTPVTKRQLLTALDEYVASLISSADPKARGSKLDRELLFHLSYAVFARHLADLAFDEDATFTFQKKFETPGGVLRAEWSLGAYLDHRSAQRK